MKVFVTDIDGVLLDFSSAVRGWIGVQYDVDPGQPFRWDFEHSYGVPKKVIGKMWDHIWGVPLRAYPGAEDFLENLVDLNVRVIGLSSRKTGAGQEASRRDLDQNDLLQYLSDLKYVEPGESKGPILAEVDPSYFLDDNQKNIYEALRDCPSLSVGHNRAFLMDRPYNTSQDIDPPYMRVRSYEAILREVRRGV